NFFKNHLDKVIRGVESLKNSKQNLIQLPSEMSELKDIKSFDFVDTVSNLTQAEIATSQGFITSLDSKIQLGLSSEGQVWERSRKYADANFIYEAPTKIPYGKVKCSEVYKRVKDFIDECNQSYSYAFQSRYLSSSQEQFSLDYPSLYNEKFAEKEKKVRAENYGKEYDESIVIANAEAKIAGQKIARD